MKFDYKSEYKINRRKPALLYTIELNKQLERGGGFLAEVSVGGEL